MQLNNLIIFLKGKPYHYRLKLKNTALHSEWSSWLIQPSESYLETANDGSVALSTVESIVINAVEIKQQGKLIAPKMIDHTAIVIKYLNQEAISFIAMDNYLLITL